MNGRYVPLRDRWERVVREDPRVTKTTLFVLLLSATYANRDGSNLRVGVKRLAEASGLGEQTIRRGLTEGRELGYLHRDVRGHRSGELVVTDEHHLTLPFPVLTPVDNAGDNSSTSGHHRPVVGGTSGQKPGYQWSPETAPVVTHDHQQVFTRNDKGAARPAWCGRCDETTRQVLDDDTHLPIALCEFCHPKRASA